MIDAKISALRQDYKHAFLLEKDANKNPIAQFKFWFNEVIEAEISEPNAMTFSSIGANNTVHSRIVLMKSFDENGFVFFTNYQSHKAMEIKNCNNVSLLFFWKEVEKQVRIEGTIEKISEEDSKEYFDSRPYNSKIGAWASNQSKVVKNRDEIDNSFETYKLQFENKEIPKPEHWGGYLIKPKTIEFWQGRSSRLHDRLLYTLENSHWKIERLMP